MRAVAEQVAVGHSGPAGLAADVLRGMILSRRISVPELVADALAAIARLDGGLHAFLSTCPERAMAEARAAQARLDAGGAPAPLTGLPLAVKDAEPVAGLRFTCGSLIHRSRVAIEDSLHVARLRAAGAIVVGKTNTPEFTLLGETRNRLGPDSRNPWNPMLTPGGSSGGSAAALAAGMVPLATGSDTAGSITVPAAFCGVVGLKPGHRRIPLWPGPEDWEPYSDVGPMARTVAGLAMMFEAAVGRDPRDPQSMLPVPALRRPDTLRISWGNSLAGLPVAGDCAGAVDLAVRLLAGTRHGIRHETPDIQDPGPLHDLLGAVEEYRIRGDLLRSHPDALVPETRAILEAGRRVSPQVLARARADAAHLAAGFRAFMAGRDIFLLPATAWPAFPLRQPPHRIAGRDVLPDWPSYAPFNMLANLTGLPVGTLPLGLTDAGLPVGVLLFANAGQERTLLSLMAELEMLRGPLSAFRPAR
ncbi:amidase [Tabrizicola soli]|uniref:Amidase n=1 Tax=Tabrizicola soli TaxID=2185115 RepID=A0ABV7DXP9_9RHOB|nr:amidase [Tabrizicola soli]